MFEDKKTTKFSSLKLITSWLLVYSIDIKRFDHFSTSSFDFFVTVFKFKSTCMLEFDIF